MTKLESFVDVLPTVHVFPVNESHGDAEATSTTGATDAVQICLLVFRNRVVDHVSHVVNVDASSGNFGGDQNVALAFTKSRHGFFACLLRHVTVKCTRLEAAID